MRVEFCIPVPVTLDIYPTQFNIVICKLCTCTIFLIILYKMSTKLHLTSSPEDHVIELEARLYDALRAYPRSQHVRRVRLVLVATDALHVLKITERRHGLY